MRMTKCILFALLLCATSAMACAPKPLYGITYAPLALDSNNMCLDTAQVEADMEIIAKLAHSVRIYNIGVCFDNAKVIFEKAKAYNMTALMGLWMEGGNLSIFEYEFQVLPYFMENYADIIESVIVGNEPIFIEEIEVDVVIDSYKRVKKYMIENGYEHPCSVAEVWPALESETGPKLVKELDFVCMNMQPYWEGFYVQCPENTTTECVSAGEYILLKAQGLANYFGKEFRLCESGWPTDGEACCSGERDNALSGFKAVPTIDNAAYFVSDFSSHAKAYQAKYYIHTSFDEEWKKIYDPCDQCKGQQVSKFSDGDCSKECTVDYKWGIYEYENRERKQGYYLPYAEAQCHFQDIKSY